MFKKLITIIHSSLWWTVWGVIIAGGILCDKVLWPGNRLKYRQAERFWASSLMKVGGIKLTISGQENLPKSETVVYMANHQSDIDWPLVFMAIPGLYLFVAKSELFHAPIFGTYMRMQNYISIERTRIRKSMHTYEKVIDMIKKGNSIVIYPEGTRSHSEELQRFKLFSFSFLRETKTRVVPVAIDGSINIQRKGSNLIRPGKVNITILPPVGFDDLRGLDNKEFCIAAAGRVRQSLLTKLAGKP